MIVWALLVIGLAYLIKTSASGIGLLLCPVFSLLVTLFIVYAAGVYGIDLEKVRDLVDTDSGNGGTTTGG